MKTVEFDGDSPVIATARSHPWTVAAASDAFRYYDLKAAPERIRTSLEDFLPWSAHPAVERFYALLEWLNAPGTRLESCDCAFTGPHATESPGVARPLECSGRVVVLFRALRLNVSPGDVTWLKDAVHAALAPIDPGFEWGVVGTTLVPARYLALPEDAPEGQLGHQLMISFWAWGATEADVMANLGRVVANLSAALHAVDAEV